MSGRTLVLKFGGAALATPERVRLAARRVRALDRSGRRPVAVASAMGRTTDRILDRIRRVAPGSGAAAAPREADRALATGEEEAAALLALALAAVGLRSVSLRGGEAGLRAEGPHGDASLADVDAVSVRNHLADSVVPVVCGFQAYGPDGETVTLGRDSSDLTAVALAAALGCACHLVTDVDGVYPGEARPGESDGPLPRLSHDELVRLAEAGAEVVHPAAARLAREHVVPLDVYGFRRSWLGGGGTEVRARTDRAAPRTETGEATG